MVANDRARTDVCARKDNCLGTDDDARVQDQRLLVIIAHATRQAGSLPQHCAIMNLATIANDDAVMNDHVCAEGDASPTRAEVLRTNPGSVIDGPDAAGSPIRSSTRCRRARRRSASRETLMVVGHGRGVSGESYQDDGGRSHAASA